MDMIYLATARTVHTSLMLIANTNTITVNNTNTNTNTITITNNITNTITITNNITNTTTITIRQVPALYLLPPPTPHFAPFSPSPFTP